MKFLKTISIALAVLLLPTVSVDAQKRRALNITDTNAAIEGIRKVMGNTLYHGKNLQSFLDDVCAKKKDDPALYTGIAKAFFYDSGVRDTANAYVYINKALAIKPNYVPAYLLKGDILFLDEDTTSALACYNKAIEMDSSYIQAYNKVILINRFKDREKTIALIKSIKNHVPTYPVNLKIADTYVSSTEATDMQIALEHYQIAERDSMKARDFQNEAFLYRTLTELSSGVEKLNAYMRMYEIGSEGLKRYPGDFDLLNIALIGAVNSHNHPDIEIRMELDNKAVEFGEQMFALAGADTLLNAKNYLAYGKALMNKNKQDDAIAIYKRLLNNEKASDEEKGTAIEKIADAYTKLGDYDKAENVYEDYIKGQEQKGTLQYKQLEAYALIYKTKAEELNGMEKAGALRKSYDIFGKAAEKFMIYADYAYFNQWLIQYNNIDVLDPSGKMHYWLEPAKKLYNYLNAKGELTDQQSSWLQTMSEHLGIYYLNTMHDLKSAKPYWLKLYSLNPDNKNVKIVLPGYYKMKI